MARSSWGVEKKISGVWTSDGTIFRPNEDLTLTKTSTASKITLADGSKVLFTPSTKYQDEPFVLSWLFVDSTLITKIEGYIEAGTAIRITDHNAKTYVGKFMSITPDWKVGEVDDSGNDLYDVDATFELFPSLA